MNPLILTKIAKFTLIGSLSALLSFIGRFNQSVRLFSVYLYIGIVFILVLALLWEGRERFTAELSEVGLSSLIPSLTSNSKPKRQYLLSPVARLELVIGFAVVTIFALIGAL